MNRTDVVKESLGDIHTELLTIGWLLRKINLVLALHNNLIGINEYTNGINEITKEIEEATDRRKIRQGRFVGQSSPKAYSPGQK